MKKPVALAMALLLALTLPFRAEAQDGPVKAAYYYKVKWGAQEEFERLFFKNHYPVLKAQMGEKGPITGIEIMRPTFPGDGRADWTFLVVIAYANLNAFMGPNEDAAIQKRLYPDQETFTKEERRRFELLDAHWDMPLTVVTPPAPERR